MSDNSFKHFIAFLCSLIAALAFVAGYFAAGFGWWWAGFTIFIIYGIIYISIN